MRSQIIANVSSHDQFCGQIFCLIPRWCFEAIIIKLQICYKKSGIDIFIFVDQSVDQATNII